MQKYLNSSRSSAASDSAGSLHNTQYTPSDLSFKRKIAEFANTSGPWVSDSSCEPGTGCTKAQKAVLRNLKFKKRKGLADNKHLIVMAYETKNNKLDFRLNFWCLQHVWMRTSAGPQDTVLERRWRDGAKGIPQDKEQCPRLCSSTRTIVSQGAARQQAGETKQEQSRWEGQSTA